MIKRSFLILTLLLTCTWFTFSAHQTTDSGIQFYHGKFEAAKALAKKEKKLVFIDAYTTWCGPCKIMAKNVFTNKEVGEYYNANFVNLKLDMESTEGVFVGKKYAVAGYPTFLFIDGDGKLIRKEMGLVDAKTFIGYGKSARSDKK